MRKAPILLAALAAALICCSRDDFGTVAHRNRDGQPDRWVAGIDSATYKVSFDRNGDGRPDFTKTFNHNLIERIEDDRNFDGKIDLVQMYSDGVLVREVHDDNFDGKPESIKTFRPNGTLAMIERDPQERGYVQVAEYYDASGKLTRRETRSK
jgi:hypothetical protein